MNGGVRRIDLPGDLFTSNDEEGEKTFATEEAPSAAFLTMTQKVKERKDRRKSRSKSIGASQFGRARVEVETMIETGNWAGVTARHLVALYDLMHEQVYDVAPADLGPAERYNAVMMAANLTKREFSGDYEKAMEFMRWAWTREMKNEKWRRENGRTDARRIGARLMFSGSLVTDYRVFLARTGKKA